MELWWNDYAEALVQKLNARLAFDEVRRADSTHAKLYRECMARRLSDDEYFYAQSVTARRNCLYTERVLDESDGENDTSDIDGDDTDGRPKLRAWRERFVLEDRLYERAYGDGSRFRIDNDEDDIDARPM